VLGVTGTTGILRRLYQEGVITQQMADEKLAVMMAAGFYSPIRSFKAFM